jgi:hypothetical protein
MIYLSLIILILECSLLRPFIILEGGALWLSKSIYWKGLRMSLSRKFGVAKDIESFLADYPFSILFDN